MPKRRELKRRRVHRTRFIDVDGDVYFISDRDTDGFEAVRLGPEDAAVVRRMRDDNEIEMESAVLARKR
ncbi:MAG: hypothetical protein U0234_32960 [Sandaracinus sp.]